jgi:hypothetical protein
LQRLDHARDRRHRAQTGARACYRFHSTADLSSELGSCAFARIKQHQYFGHACKNLQSQTTHRRAALLLWE